MLLYPGKEHQRNLKNYTKGSHVVGHALQTNHSIDFDNAVIEKGYYHVRKRQNPRTLTKRSVRNLPQNRCIGNTPF